MRLTHLLIPLAVLLAPLGALAQPDAHDAGAAAPAAASPDAALAPAATADAGLTKRLADPDAPATTKDVTDAAVGAVSGIKTAIDQPTLLGITGAIAACLWALIAALKKWGPAWISSTKIRWATLIISPIAIFLGAYASGVGWFNALVLAGGGPGATLLNEIGRAVKPASA